MEAKEIESMKHLSLPQSVELSDWLVDKGLGMGECAHLITDIELGDSFGMALLKVFKRREVLERSHEKVVDWTMPIIG